MSSQNDRVLNFDDLDNESEVKRAIINTTSNVKKLKSKKRYQYDEFIKEVEILPITEIVLEEFQYMETIYYKDSAGGIWNSNCKLVGIINDDESVVLFELLPKYNLVIE